MKFTTKPKEVEALTFNELVGIGIARCQEQGQALVNDMPWSFNYAGKPVTHENDDCYLIGELRFSRGQMLVNDSGDLSIMDVDEFAKHYTFAE